MPKQWHVDKVLPFMLIRIFRRIFLPVRQIFNEFKVVVVVKNLWQWQLPKYKCSYFSNRINAIILQKQCLPSRLLLKYAFLRGSSFLPLPLPLNFCINEGLCWSGRGFLSWLTKHRIRVTSGGGNKDIFGGCRYDWL